MLEPPEDKYIGVWNGCLIYQAPYMINGACWIKTITLNEKERQKEGKEAAVAEEEEAAITNQHEQEDAHSNIYYYRNMNSKCYKKSKSIIK